MPESTLLVLASIGVLGLIAQWLAWWLKLPAILFLLLFGLIAGPVTGWIRPDDLFGDLLFPLVSLGVAVILFEGALTLRLHEIRGHGTVVRNLVTVGMLINGGIIALAANQFMGLSWQVAAVFGAMVSVTGPTVIVPILRTVRPKASVANILRWEGILIDPLGALLAVLVFEFVVSGQEEQATLLVFGKVLALGGGLGALGAAMIATILKRHLLPEYLINMATLILVLMIFALSNSLVEESGLLAVTVMGAILANWKGINTEGILDFKEHLSLLLISALFVVLAARIEPRQFLDLGWGMAGVLVVVLLVARPLSVWISAIGSSLDWREKALLSWVAPRGIVAAAVSALFALKLESRGYAEAGLLKPLTFVVILATVILQSFTARWVARKLGVAEPEPKGILIVGANRLARAIGKALSERGYTVLLADTSWDDIKAARMDGLPTYFGNPVSEHADRHLDLVGLGRLFALSPRPALNALACIRYRPEFGGNHIFTVRNPEEESGSEKRKLVNAYQSDKLFTSKATFFHLNRSLAEGARIKATALTANFDYDAYRAQNAETAIAMFAFDPKGRLHIFTENKSPKPAVGWTVLSLLLQEQPAEVASV